jgi:hypothetical protein
VTLVLKRLLEGKIRQDSGYIVAAVEGSEV